MAQTYNLTADGSTAALQTNGVVNVAAYGTFGGGTLTIQASYDGGTTYFDLTDANSAAGAFTANGALNVEVGEADLRFTLAGSTSPNLNISVTGIINTSRF
jgi:hypothetical protein